MKRSYQYFLVCQLASVIASNAQAKPWIGIGIGSGLSDLQMQSSLLQREGNAVSILKDHTGKFENDNTFVQLYNPAFNTDYSRLTHRSVFISLASRLNHDSLMEALIKVRAARTLGASEVTVRSSQSLRDIILEGEGGGEMNLEELLAVAGADSLVENNVERPLIEPRVSRSFVTESEYFIGGTSHLGLLSEVSTLLSKEPKTFEELRAHPESLKGRRVYWVASTTPPVNDGFFTTLAQIQWMKSQGASVHLISPYLPYARSDKPEFDVGVTTQGRLAADLIEAAGTQGITVVRAHAPQSLGFFKIHATEISGRPTLVEYLKSQDVDCVISPDAGFQKDATKYQHELTKAYAGLKTVCLAVMNKERNSDGKERILGGTGLEKIAGKQIVIVDDETSTGGTLSQVAQVLQEYHPKSIFAVVTHLAGPATKVLSSEFVQKLIVTNTVPVSVTAPKLTVLSIAPEIAQEIRRGEANRN